MNFKQISIIMLVVLLTSPVIASVDEVQQAITVAKQDAKGDVSMVAWGSGGFVCGGFAVLYAYFSTPQVPVHQLIGKSPTYVNTYAAVYKQNVKRKRMQATIIGCGVASGISAITTLILTSQLNL